MPDLSFAVHHASVVPFAASPAFAFALHVENKADNECIRAVMLNCQVRIEAARRSYAPNEQVRLRDLFGEPHRWGTTLKSMLWTHVTAVVPQFEDATDFSLIVPATFDFTIATTKYFHALEDGAIPLTFLFSGSVFYEAGDGPIQVHPLSWESEATFALPSRQWQQLMDAYYPNTAWLALRRDAFDQLQAYKSASGIPTWEQLFEGLLPAPTPTAP